MSTGGITFRVIGAAGVRCTRWLCFLIGSPCSRQYPAPRPVVSTAGGGYPKPVYPGGQLTHNVPKLIYHERTHRTLKLGTQGGASGLWPFALPRAIESQPFRLETISKPLIRN